MYEPDLARIKRLFYINQPPPFTLPSELPAGMAERGYRLEAGVLYWESLPMSEMSARGVIKLFKERVQ